MAGQVGSDDGEVGFQIAPMVDVVFVLMLFFMANAGLQVAERELGMNLPGGGQGVPGGAPPTPIMVDIKQNGQVVLNNIAYDTPQSEELPALQKRFEEIILQAGEDNPVIVRPEPQVPHERVIDVLNAAAAAGVKNLTFG